MQQIGIRALGIPLPASFVSRPCVVDVEIRLVSYRRMLASLAFLNCRSGLQTIPDPRARFSTVGITRSKGGTSWFKCL